MALNQMGVSYNTKSAGKCEHLQRGGGSINRLQMYIGDTNANCDSDTIGDINICLREKLRGFFLT